MAMICVDCGNDAIWTGCTPTGDKYMCSDLKCRSVTLFALVKPKPVESVTHCVVCNKILDGKSDQITCSNRCRQRKYRTDKKASKKSA